MRARSVAYWVSAVVLMGFGYLSLFSIGAPILLTGLAMVVVGPWRRRRGILWSALAAVWALVLGYILVAPLGCTTSSIAVPAGPGTVGHTTCANLIGIDYSGLTPYSPPFGPALLVGLGAAVLVGAGLHALLRRRSATAPARPA